MICACAVEKDLDALDRVAARRIPRTLNRFSGTGHADLARIVNARTARRRVRVGPYRIVILVNEELGEAEIIRIHRRDSAYRTDPHRRRRACPRPSAEPSSKGPQAP